MTVLGAILAGGQSRRFGRDKALVEWRGQTLIEHVAVALAPFVETLVVCGRTSAPRGFRVTPDRPASGLGPLGGLCGALQFAREHGMSRVITVPCDAPVVPNELLEALRQSDDAAYLPQAPVFGIWPAAHATRLEAHLRSDEDRSIRRWASIVGAHQLRFEGTIPNLNAPQDWETFVRDAPGE
jgi:molybdopterin-guanine dinucleotide biosynthesis protein A